MKRQIETGKTLYRSAPITRAAIDADLRTVRLSISSDVPYLRQDIFGSAYYECLDHSPGGVVTDRLTAGTALLFNHDTSKHIGRNTSFENDGHKITVTSKFSRSVFAEEKWQDVVDGILVDTSVGYQVLSAEETDDEIEGVPVYKMKWLPLEASLCPIPADYTVGVGRSHQTSNQPNNTMTTETNTTQTQPNERTATQERERINHINFLANRPTFRRFVGTDEVQRAIDEGWSKRAFTDHVMAKIGESPMPIGIPVGHGDFRAMGNGAPQSLAGRLVTSPDFKKFLSQGGRSRSMSMDFPDVPNLRAALTLSGTGVGMIDQTNQLVLTPTERLTISDLFAQGTTTGTTVRYLQENPFTNTAAAVAEGAAKPELTLDMEPKDAPVRKLAAWTKITQEMLEDLGTAEQFVSMRLRYAVELAEEEELLAGDGTGQHITGILNTAGIQTQTLGGADTVPDAIRKAITKIQVNAKMQPTGLVLHPNDYETISLLKDSQGKYLIGDIFAMTEMGTMIRTPSLWGLPIVVTTSMTENTALVGAFKPAAWLWRRTGVTISGSNSDGDNFVKNLVTMLAEERLAAACVIPPAFCSVTSI